MALPKLRFKEFDGDWSASNLEQTTQYFKGFAFKSESYKEEGIRIIRVSDLDKDSIKYQNEAIFLDKNEANNYLNWEVKKKDIIVTTVGSKPHLIDSAVGRPIFVKKDNEGLLNQNLLVLRPKNENIDAYFIFSQLLDKKYLTHIETIQRGNANQSNITVKDLQEFEVFQTSKAEQTKIASFLSAVDEKISQLTQKQKLLSQYKQGMMQKLFSQQIRFKADDGNEFGEWENVILDDVILGMQSGLSRQLKDEDTGLIVLRSNNVIDNKISYLDIKFWYLDDPQGANVENYILEDGDILVNFINSMAQIGKSALYRKVLDRKIICTTNILRVQANKLKVKPEFLNSIFQTNEYENYIQSITKPAVNQASFTTKEFKMMKFKLPCLEEQTKIANFLSAIDQKIEVVAQQIEQAKQWKKGLLQQMFV